jgi:hypothetical protein
MGNSGSAQDPRTACASIIAELSACKASVGLRPNECYEPNYRGDCDALELAQRRCVAHAACPRAAERFYNGSRPRKERVAANTELQACLNKRKDVQQLLGCTRRRPALAAAEAETEAETLASGREKA